MKNDKIYVINIANKYSINPQVIEKIFKLMDNWFVIELIEDISHYTETNEMLKK